MADPSTIAAVQRERRRALPPIMPEGERADSNVHQATRWIARIADYGAEILRHNLPGGQ
jgi:hypothetical protein